MLKKVKHKFILLNMLIVSAILLLVFISICIVTYNRELAMIYKELEISATTIDNDFSVIPPDNFVEKDNIFKEKSSFSIVSAVVNKSGEIIKAYNGKEESQPTEILKEITKAALIRGNKNGILSDYSVIYSKTVTPHKTVISYASLSVATGRLNAPLRITGLALLSCLGLFFILSYLLAGLAIKPAEKAWKAQKQFIQDASHDLKTPLTVILANNDVISLHKNESVSEITKWLESTKEEAERMRRLVDSMLELANTENHDGKMELCEIDISDITQNVILQMEPVAFEKYITINNTVENDVIIKGDADSYTRLMHILIDNGIKYSDQKSELDVTLVRDKRDVKLTVRNYGPVIDREDLDHIFERFYRSDKARGNAGGFGLGLSIAKNLCENMRGTIKAESSELSGTAFTAIFPIN